MTSRKINQISAWLLAVGFTAAIVVFFVMPPDEEDDPLLSGMQGRRYQREMRMIGGKANLASAEIVDGFLDLWHGRALAGTLAVVTVAGTLLFRFMAANPDPVNPPAEDRSKPPPSSPT